MKLWLVETSKYDYDEYDSFIVRAESSEQAYQIVIAFGYTSNFQKETTTITEVTVEGEAGIIHSSYNAG